MSDYKPKTLAGQIGYVNAAFLDLAAGICGTFPLSSSKQAAKQFRLRAEDTRRYWRKMEAPPWK